ncbi:MAG: ribosome maturation factor RimP [Candidatus Hydrogenedentes bacterium]|nr:ribosome maturation factor RimP [Candidatus Hydrogenedentota bacterium]
MEAAALVRQAWQILEPELQDIGYELVEVEYSQQGGAVLLRLFIDKEEGGISLADCTRVTHILNPVLDETEFILGRYLLEVSSPGWNRPVRKPEHFQRVIGEMLRVVTNAPAEGRTKFKGVLKSIDKDMICLDVSGQEVTLHLENIKKARLDR